MTSLRSYIRSILQENFGFSMDRVAPEVAKFVKWNGNQMDMMRVLGISMSTDLKSSPRLKEIIRIAKANDIRGKMTYHFTHEKGLKITGKNAWVIIMLDGDKLVPAGTGTLHKLKENIGDVEWEWESGSMTHDGNQLILFAENDMESYDYTRAHQNDKKAIFEFVYARFSKLHPGVLINDKETVMYDFMANYQIY